MDTKHKKYKLTKDIVIPAGTVMSVDPPKSTFRAYEQVYYLRAETKDVTSEWLMALDEAIEIGLIELIED